MRPPHPLQVRGPNYLVDRIKFPSRQAVFRPIGLHTYRRGEGRTPMFHMAAEVPSLAAHLKANPDKL